MKAKPVLFSVGSQLIDLGLAQGVWNNIHFNISIGILNYQEFFIKRMPKMLIGCIIKTLKIWNKMGRHTLLTHFLDIFLLVEMTRRKLTSNTFPVWRNIWARFLHALLFTSAGHPQVEKNNSYFLELNLLISLGKYLLQTSYMLGPVLGTEVRGTTQRELGRVNSRQEAN